MMKKIIFSQVLLGLVLWSFTGCKKKRSEEFLGPQYNATPATLYVSNDQFVAYNIVNSTLFFNPVPATSVNIFTNSQFYRADFSDEVRWKVTIYSWKSKAEKVLTGYGKFIDSTNCKWNGSSDNEYFFGFPGGIPDSAEVKLTFMGSDRVIRDTMRITQMRDYHHVTYNGVYHYLVDDFDNGNDSTALSAFYPDADDLGAGNNGNPGYPGMKCQGNFSYRMIGTDVNNNTYLGSCNTPTQNDIKPGTFQTTDPDQLYINMFIYGFGKPNTTISVIAYENDADQPIGTYNTKDGATTVVINDKLIYQIGVTWKGWKLVSIPYSGFRKPNTDGGKGNNRLNPEKLCGLALELDSYPSAGFNVEALVDMLTITEYGTFQK